MQFTGTLRPSFAPVWSYCAAAPAMSAGRPEIDGEEAREGTAAHYYPTEFLQGRNWPIGTMTPSGIPLDADMLKFGQLLISDVLYEYANIGDPNATLGVETKVFPHTLIHPKVEGTPDVFLFSYALRKLILWDYKYGFRLVDVWGNEQFLAYVAGVLEGFGLTREEIFQVSVEVRVMQPRAPSSEGPLRTWKTNGAAVFQQFARLAEAATACLAPDPVATTGPYCRDCPALAVCSIGRAAVGSALDVVGRPVVDELTPETLGTELALIDRALRILKDRKTALDAQAVHFMKDLRLSVPFYEIGYVNTHEKWAVADADVIAVGDLLGVDLRDGKAIKPAAARELFQKRGLDAKMLAAYHVKPPGAAKIVPSKNQALKAFS